MINGMNSAQWTLEVMADEPLHTLAKRAGIVGTTLQRQIMKGDVSSDNIILLARALSLNPVMSLIETGYLTEQEAANGKRLAKLHSASDVELAEEILRRALNDKAGFCTRPISVINDEQDTYASTRDSSDIPGNDPATDF